MSPLDEFTLLRQEQVEEINAEARLYRHNTTGAEVLSLVSDDDNKVFGVNFRTPPADSTGVPHIVEHSVFCGSRKYPVKEPFKELMKGSLHTFMNAMTYPDKTVYPIASQNLKDFYNLMDVYLDAVFFPRLTREVFEQEGWHYELPEPDAEMVYKGVVYNEMKGVYSSADNLMYEYAQHSLFPDTIYQYDSGGSPEAIRNLSFEDFQRFHQHHYNPSNARFYFYGNDDPDERLRKIAPYLEGLEAQEPAADIALQPRFEQPIKVQRRYAVDPDSQEASCYVVQSWLTGDVTNMEESLALYLLAYLLVGSPASPLRRKLMESGLGEDLVGTGFEGQIRETYFSTGLKGVAAEKTDDVLQLLEDTLREIHAEGFDPDIIEAAFNTTEFSLRENNTGSYPRGLAYMLRALTSWNYDGDPLAPLRFEPILAAVKQQYRDNPKFFADLLSRVLLDNPHRATLVMEPDPALNAQQQQEEKEQLETKRTGMDASAVDETVRRTQHLEELQRTPDEETELAKVPTLTLQDIERPIRTVSTEHDDVATSETLYHDLSTNGILYLDLAFDMHSVPSALLKYLPLFGRALTELGTDKEDYVTLTQRIARKTGGIDTTLFTIHPYQTEDTAARMIVRSKVLSGRSRDLFEILRDILLSLNFDNRERFRQMVLEEKAGEESNLHPNGHQVVRSRMNAHYSTAEWVSEQLGGVDYLAAIQDLADQIESDWDRVKAALETIRDHLITSSGLICNVTVDRKDWNRIRGELSGLIQQLPSRPGAAADWHPSPLPPREALILPAQVHYVGKAVNLYDAGYTFNGSSLVVCRHIRTNWLWDRVRVQGGAYGCFCGLDRNTGVLGFVSYRDPNVSKTLSAYDASTDFLRSSQLTREEVDKNIIGMIGDLEPYLLPDARGYGALMRHLSGINDELRQQIKDEVLNTSLQDFTDFAGVLEQALKKPVVTAMGPEESLQAQLGGENHLVLTPLLR